MLSLLVDHFRIDTFVFVVFIIFIRFYGPREESDVVCFLVFFVRVTMNRLPTTNLSTETPKKLATSDSFLFSRSYFSQLKKKKLI